MLLTVAHQISCSFRHLVRAKERAVRCRLAITASWVTLKNYLDAFKSRLNPQLFHQFPGLGDVISSGHTDPLDCANTEENWETPRDGTKNDCRDVAPPRAHYSVVQQCRTKEQWTCVIHFQVCGFFFYLSDSRWLYSNAGRGWADSITGCQSWRAGELTLALSCETGQQVTWLQREGCIQTL